MSRVEAPRTVSLGQLRAVIAKLPPGPYQVQFPDEQGGAYRLWGRSKDEDPEGWALPLVATGVGTCIEAIAELLNLVWSGLDPSGDEVVAVEAPR